MKDSQDGVKVIDDILLIKQLDGNSSSLINQDLEEDESIIFYENGRLMAKIQSNFVSITPISNDGNTLFVSKGPSSTDSRGRLSKYDQNFPFSTLSAAKSAAENGDLIVVLPGIYDENNLLKNGVNWHFMPGAKVIFTGNSGAGIWDDSDLGFNGNVSCTISGSGFFSRQGSGNHRDVFYIENDSDIVANFYRMESIGRGVIIRNGLLSIVADSALTGDGALDTTGGHLYAKFRSIESTGPFVVENDGGIFEIECFLIKSQGEASVYNGSGIVKIRANSILNTGSGYAVTSNGGGVVTDIDCKLIHSSLGNAVYAGESGAIKIMNSKITSDVLTPISISGDSLTLSNCLIVSQTLESIEGSGDVGILSVASNVAVSETVNEVIGTIIVHSSVH